MMFRVIGIGSGVDTFSGQAFGAQQFPLLGIILQRATLICCLVAAAPLAAWTQADKLMRFLGKLGVPLIVLDLDHHRKSTGLLLAAAFSML